jgi:hypothetical protein
MSTTHPSVKAATIDGGRPSMTQSREIREQIERCVATIVYYHKDGWSWSGAKLLVEEAAATRAWAARMDLEDCMDAVVLAPLVVELTDRFGPEIGMRLHREFQRALGDASKT